MTLARLRIAFALLALALAIPGALLVRRALASVATEREARNRAVAERVFDEMERALTELLAAEEARPVAHYEFASETKSPLRERPASPLVVGYFQIEADGRVLAPPWAERVVPLAHAIGADGARLEAGLAAGERRAALEARRSLATEAEEDRAEAPAPRAPESAAPVSERKDIVEERAPDARSKSDDLAAYEALSKLNVGAKQREQRAQKIYVAEQQAASAEESAPEDASDERSRAQEMVASAFSSEPSAPAEEPTATSLETDAKAESSAAAPAAGAIADAPAAPQKAAEEQPAHQGRTAAAPGAAPPSPQPARDGFAGGGEQLVRVVVDPLRGRLAASGELVLSRTVWIGARSVRQGLALDVAELERWVAERTLRGGAVPGARAQLAPRAQLAAASVSPERLAFTRRFAEPFDALGVELSFPPFADGEARTVYWLAASLALAAALGLLAVYRMTALALHFAQRRSNFAAAVSHELKTPLTAIRLYAEMLRDGLVASDEKRREYYGSITAETERLSRLINNVLEFSRLEKGARELELCVGDVAPAVREAVDLLRPHAAQHGLALELTLDDALPAVRFERDALLQVLFNLIDNAVKYGRGEPARIEVSCRRAGDGVLLAVRDHGPGVPREELARILEPFYRRGDELTRAAQGAGIGLALVKALADRMGALFEVGAAEGGGFHAHIALRAS